MSQQTPAGWYPDPDNSQQQRYWDGQQWTEHRAQAAPAEAQAGRAGGLSTPAKVAIGVMGGLVLIGGCAALLGSSGDDETANPGAATTTPAAPAQSESGPPPTPTEEPKYRGRITSAEPVNPATMRFNAIVKRPAGQSDQEDVAVTCQVIFSDSSGNYYGVRSFDTDILAYSSRRLFGGDVTVTNEGAVWVTQQSIKCRPS